MSTNIGIDMVYSPSRMLYGNENKGSAAYLKTDMNLTNGIKYNNPDNNKNM
jgi:hypothetical protein